MRKRIVIGALAAVALVTAAIPFTIYYRQQSTTAAKPTYLYTLATSEKEKFIVTNLTDGRLVRMQVTLEIDGDHAPKDVKNPGREYMAMQDSVLQAIRKCRSKDLEPQNQTSFKKSLTESAGKVIGQESVVGVYITNIAVR